MKTITNIDLQKYYALSFSTNGKIRKDYKNYYPVSYYCEKCKCIIIKMKKINDNDNHYMCTKCGSNLNIEVKK